MKKVLLGCLSAALGGLTILLCLLFLRNLRSTGPLVQKQADKISVTEPESISAGETEELDSDLEREVKPAVIVMEPEEEVTLLFGGDVCLQDFITEKYETDGISGILSKTLLDVMKQSDITMVNQEFSFSSRGTAMEDKEYTFRTHPDKVEMFSDMGIDIVSLANNHAMDFGRDALADSFETLGQAGILYVGAGENLDRAKKMEVIESNGKKIGFLAASRVIPVGDWNAGSISGMLTTYDPALLLEAIKSNRAYCDILIVYVHWGIERNEYPEEYQKKMAKQYIDAGADVVIGSHPHVMQGIEYYKDKPIAYSLGNYIFSTRYRSGSLLKIKIGKENDISVCLLPFVSSSFPIVEMEGDERKKFFEYMEQISFGIHIDEEGNVLYNKE